MPKGEAGRSGSQGMTMDASEGVKASSMQAAILAFGVISLPLLIITFGMGYGVHYGWWGVTVSTHLKFGLVTAIMTMLTHTTTMFYFMGTGSAIKHEVRERDLSLSYLRRARAFKGSFFYALFFGMLLIMAAAMLGGGAHSDLLRPVQPAGQSMLSRVHELLAILSLGVNLIALVQTPIYIVRNNILLDEVMGDDAVRASDEVDEAPVEQAKE